MYVHIHTCINYVSIGIKVLDSFSGNQITMCRDESCLALVRKHTNAMF